MTTAEEQNKLRDKILVGLKLSYKRLIEFKKIKKSELIIMKDGKIVKIKPEDL
jgi:hypothetical protein